MRDNNMSSKQFIENESGYHKSAKKILCEWLKTGGFNDFPCSGGKWFGDGVFMEYPLISALNEYESFGGCLSFNYLIGDDRMDYYSDKHNDERCPTYNECVAYGDIPVAILDLAIVYKGFLSCGFEICYKNKVSEEKKQKLQIFKGAIEIYEINANDILKQVKKPDNILDYCIKIL
jgi:hypothetical protein